MEGNGKRFYGRLSKRVRSPIVHTAKFAGGFGAQRRVARGYRPERAMTARFILERADTVASSGRLVWSRNRAVAQSRARRASPASLAHGTDSHCTSHASSGAGTLVPVEGGTRCPDVL